MALGLVGTVEAQGLRVTGRVVRMVGGDSTAVVGRWVVLHAVLGPTEGAAIDSQRTDRTGRYALGQALVDTSALYLTSVEHQDVAYFSEAFAPPPSGVEVVPPLVVYDTSATDPPIEVAERHVLVRRPESGGRRVVELFVLVNRGERTRVAADSFSPVWQGAVTPLAREFEIGMSDLGTDAIEYHANTLTVFAPIPPGERQILVGYLLGSNLDSMTVIVDQPIERLSILLEDSLASLDAPALTLRGVEELDGSMLRRYGAESIERGARVTLRFGSGRRARSPVVWIVIPLAAVVLFGVFALWWRRTRMSAAPGEDDPAALAADIAALDAARTTMDEETYRARRAELKARLSAALAPPSAPH
ncbi:MAG: hypothetical protein OER90_17385 [Gemmatimonadota bacterium]|nr:hypothetical protein [Gemmatimonadota bacterium]